LPIEDVNRRSAIGNRQSAMTAVGVPVATLLRDLAEYRGIDLELVAGAAGLDRRISNPHPQKTGLALTGFDKYLREGRVLVLGESEVRFLESLGAAERTDVVTRVLSHALPCLVVTAGFNPPVELSAEADRVDLPLLKTRDATPLVMARLSAALDCSFVSISVCARN
jgi:HPr kinase/phosphorylase